MTLDRARPDAPRLRRYVAIGALAAFAGCSDLPSLEGRSVSTAYTDTADTGLGRAIAPQVAAHPGKAGILALAGSLDAFAARLLLARAAERSLDIQYYIWNLDLSGMLLLHAVKEAADRGVRVRLLLDDNNTPGLDPTLAGLDAHPDIEVRLFNPFSVRRPRFVGYLTDFPRLNRRMHNKSFTADNQATIVGGRNVGDEYFDAAEGLVFVDLDVLVVGQVVNEVSKDFDRYWASGSAYPVDRLLPRAESAALPQPDTARARTYVDSVARSPLVDQLMEGRLALEWAPTRMVSDDPAKGLGRVAPSALLPHRLGELLGAPTSTVELVSAYFVPATIGTRTLVDLARRGVNVRILTNSLAATVVLVVHAGYAKRRKALLREGVTLYELQRLSPDDGREGDARRLGGSGSSVSSLHAKTFSVDGARVFVGSFNFDPRSANLNTEMGFVIDSPMLAQRIDRAFEGRIPQESYEARLDDNGTLYWLEHRAEGPVRHDTEPKTRFWERLVVRLLSLLPLEWLL